MLRSKIFFHPESTGHGKMQNPVGLVIWNSIVFGLLFVPLTALMCWLFFRGHGGPGDQSLMFYILSGLSVLGSALMVVGFNVCFAWIGVRYGIEYSNIFFAVALLIVLACFAGYVVSVGGLHKLMKTGPQVLKAKPNHEPFSV